MRAYFARLCEQYERLVLKIHARLAPEHFGWHGRVRVTARYADGSVEVSEFDNMIMDAGRNLVRDALGGIASDCKIRYVALGSGTSAPVKTQTKLDAEQYRKAVTKQTQGAAGVLTTTVYIPPADANSFTIGEIAWFAGPTAGTAKDSGVMVARVNYTRAKSQLESLQIDRVDTFA